MMGANQDAGMGIDMLQGTDIVVETTRSHYSCCKHERFSDHKSFTRHMISDHFLIGKPGYENEAYFCTACTQEEIRLRSPSGILTLEGIYILTH